MIVWTIRPYDAGGAVLLEPAVSDNGLLDAAQREQSWIRGLLVQQTAPTSREMIRHSGSHGNENYDDNDDDSDEYDKVAARGHCMQAKRIKSQYYLLIRVM